MPSQTASLDTTALLNDLRGVFEQRSTRGSAWRLSNRAAIDGLDERGNRDCCGEP